MSDAKDSRAGSMFGPYHLKRVLGQGGMGAVYEAEHTVKGWTVAVKLMSEALSQDPVFRERMKREARHTGRLQEPHVVPIHDYGEIDGQMYLEMRLIEGTDLDRILKESGPLTPPRAVAIITQIASALDAAHAAGVMHRDVKPQNILVTREDFAYLVDFGIASATTDEKITKIGTAVGTWKYMAPERFSIGEVNHRADVYALACVLYECLTGAPPYASDSAGVLVTSHMMDPIPQPSMKRSGVPRSLDAVIERGMAKRPEERYATAGELARAAHQALTDSGQDQAEDILRRSMESTTPHKAVARPPATHTPPGYTAPVNSGRTPPPTPTRPPTWVSTSGPRPTPGPPPGSPGGPLPGSPGGPLPGRPPGSPGGPVPGSPGGPLPGRPPGSPGGPLPGSPGGPLPGRPPGSPGGPVPGPISGPISGPQGMPPPGVPQHFTGPTGGPPPWHQPAPAPRRGRNPWPIVAGVAVLVVVLVIGAIIVGKIVSHPEEPPAADTSTTTTTTTTTTPYTTAPTTTRTTTSADLQRLLQSLPAGYPASACTQDTRPMPGAIVSVKCGRHPDPDGPTVAAYGLFPTVESVQTSFTNFIKTFTIQNCPGNKASPGTWWHNKDPNTVLGQIACGVYKGNEPQVMWSNQQTMVFALVEGSVQGPTLDQLYKWWASHS